MHEGELTRKTALGVILMMMSKRDPLRRHYVHGPRSISLLHLAVDEDLYCDINIILPGEDHNTRAQSVRCRQTERPLKNLLTVFPRINKHRGGAAAVHSVAAA